MTETPTLYRPTSWTEYPKVYNVGHRAVQGIFNGLPVVLEEKVDGSQFSFGLFADGLRVKSKGQTFPIENPPAMFRGACETVYTLSGALVQGWTYRAEVLQSERHNVLAYDRVPKGNLILFDIADGPESYLSHEAKRKEAQRLGLECVPAFDVRSTPPTLERIEQDFLRRESCLGGAPVEGFVLKNYYAFGVDGKPLFAKHVSTQFREAHGKEKYGATPRTEFIEALAMRYRTDARWQKAYQHLLEADAIEHSPRDIGSLIQEVHRDILEECRDEIALALFEHFRRQLIGKTTAGLPEWYKQRLLEEQFGAD